MKLLNADDSVRSPHAKVGRCQDLNAKSPLSDNGTAYHSEKIKHIIEQLPIETDLASEYYALGRLLELAREYEITVYDAAYLELSLRHVIPLATLDKKLSTAARQAGIPVLPLVSN